ncbi:hypothetical protein [Cryptosporangium japonicum]|uniref:Integral membrane protein n=1 Tax=Cryptosporangium japonicum TaxID=80872 RepID=A0ABN0UW63_9ACTN
MVLLGLLLAAVAIALGVGLALQPGDTANVHFFGLNIPNLNGRTLILVGIAIGILFMIGVSFIRWGFAIARRRRRERKAAKRAPVEAPVAPREQPEPEPDHEAARREELAAWERAETARREEAARQEEAALRARSETHQPDPYPPASPDSYPGHRPPEPYRGDNSPTDAYPMMGEHKTEEYPTVDPYRDEPPRTTGTVYQSGGHSYPDNDPYGNGPQQPPQHRPY